MLAELALKPDHAQSVKSPSLYTLPRKENEKNQGNVKENGKKKKEEERGEDVGSFSRSHEERNARVYERDACRK